MGIFSPKTVSVGDLFAGALLPGLMLVGLYILYQLFRAFIHPHTSPALPPDAALEGLTRGQVIVKVAQALLPPVILIVAVLGSILAGIASPTEAAGVGAVGALMLAGLRLDEHGGWSIYGASLCLVGVLVLTAFVDLRVTRDDIPAGDMAGIVIAALMCLGVAYGVLISLYRAWRKRILHDVVRSTAQVSSMVFVILIGAALFSLTFRGLGGEQLVHEFLTGMPGGVWGAIVVVMIVMFIMGFFLDFIEITFVVVPIVSPVLFKLGVDPVWLGVLIAMNLQTSFLTPPFGFALFYLRGVAPSSIRTMDIYRGVIPFVGIQIVALFILAVLPQMATWLPKVVFGD
jgi:TRAP-type mannitol/chloroaromatic compound transport system permease large subunit